MLKFRCTDSTQDRTLAKLERILFFGFYSIRKLIDAVKLSNSTVESKWSVMLHPNQARVDLLNWHRIEDKYSLGEARNAQKSLRWLCNQVIHSFVFILDFDESGKLSGVFVASDWERSKSLVFIGRNTILKIFKLVGSDYPHESRRFRNSNEDWVTEQW